MSKISSLARVPSLFCHAYQSAFRCFAFFSTLNIWDMGDTGNVIHRIFALLISLCILCVRNYRRGLSFVYACFLGSRFWVTQMLNKEFGGSVKALDMREDGQYTIQVHVDSPLFK